MSRRATACLRARLCKAFGKGAFGCKNTGGVAGGKADGLEGEKRSGGAFWVPFLVGHQVELVVEGKFDAFLEDFEVEGAVDFVERRNEAMSGGVEG